MTIFSSISADRFESLTIKIHWSDADKIKLLVFCLFVFFTVVLVMKTSLAVA